MSSQRVGVVVGAGDAVAHGLDRRANRDTVRVRRGGNDRRAGGAADLKHAEVVTLTWIPIPVRVRRVIDHLVNGFTLVVLLEAILRVVRLQREVHALAVTGRQNPRGPAALRDDGARAGRALVLVDQSDHS